MHIRHLKADKRSIQRADRNSLTHHIFFMTLLIKLQGNNTREAGISPEKVWISIPGQERDIIRWRTRQGIFFFKFSLSHSLSYFFFFYQRHSSSGKMTLLGVAGLENSSESLSVPYLIPAGERTQRKNYIWGVQIRPLCFDFGKIKMQSQLTDNYGTIKAMS